MARRILGLIAGIVTGFVVTFAVQAPLGVVFPPPPGFDPSDPEWPVFYFATLPTAAFLWLIAAHTAGAFLAGLVCAKIAPGWRPGWFLLGGIALGADIWTLQSIPFPHWFAVVDLALQVPAAFFGGIVGTGSTLESEPPTDQKTDADT